MQHFRHLITLFFTFSLTFSFAQIDIELLPYASGFSSPIDIANAGDPRLFVVERAGTIKVIEQSGVVISFPFLDITDRVHFTGGQSEQGLLSLTFHPDYFMNGFFYVHYIRSNDNSVISRFQVDPQNPNIANASSELILMDVPQPFSNHNGGDLAFGPDGYLYIGFGDGGSAGDPGNRAQNTQTFMGKMLRIDVDNGSPYAIPTDNPFVNNSDVLDEIWSIGLRNPWRFSFDRTTGDMWIGDVGQNAQEEIDVQLASSTGGENYGWRCYEGTNPYNTNGCGSVGEYVPPVFTYPHGTGSCSVTGGFVYRGTESPYLVGKYVLGDYCSGKLWTVEPDGNGGWTSAERGTFPGYNFSSFGEGFQGEMYVATLSSGTIYKLAATACSIFTMNVEITDETCLGESDGSINITLENGTGPYTTTWSIAYDGLNPTDLVTGTYAVTIEDSQGCQVGQSINIENGSASNFALEADGDTDLCSGGTVTLNAAPAPEGYTYQWFNGVNQLTETTSTIEVSIAGNYFYSLEGPCPSLGTSNWVEVTAGSAPDAPFLSVDGANDFCADGSVTLLVPDAPAGYSIQWYESAQAISGATANVYTGQTEGIFTAQYIGDCDSELSNFIELGAEGPFLVIDFALGTCVGETVDIADSAVYDANNPNNTLTFHTGSPATEANLLTNTVVSITENTNYVAFAQNGSCSDELEFTVTVNALPTQPVISVDYLTLSIPDEYTNYQWYFEGNEIADANANTLEVIGNGTYSVEVFNDNNCSIVSDELFFMFSSTFNLQGINAVEVLPNPFTNQFILQIESESSKELQLNIQDELGKLIYTKKISVNKNWSEEIDLNNAPAGIYFLNLSNKEGQWTKRLVKQ